MADLTSLGVSGGAGIDVGAFVQQMLFAERAPARLWENERAKLNTQSAALSDINAKLLALQEKTSALRDPLGGLNAQSGISSAPDVLTLTADGTAVPASHMIAVSSLATTSSYYAGPFADSVTAFGQGSFELQVGSGPAVTIVVDGANNTLESLVEHINNLGLGVRAGIITDAHGARLSLLSETSGAPGDLTVANNSTGLSFTKAVTGANAAFTVNGIPLSTATNTVDTVLAGVTINLLGVSAAPVTATVRPDAPQGRAAVEEFVAAYNAVVGAINAQFTFNPATGAAPPLFGNSSLRMVQQNLLGAATYALEGAADGLTSPAAVGVSMRDDGTLSVDGAALEAALTGDFTGVQALFQADSTGWAVNFATQLHAMTNSLDGPLALELRGIASSESSLSQRIADFDARLEFRRQALVEQFSRIDGMLRQLPLLMAQLESQLAALPKRS